ncbi:MAG: pyruvate, phosphate dikinase [Peptostreptococcaceae bacterium]|nr:pyruvate, phosphate dikinase [Peptostreptococcaceae bacterium]
MKKFIYNFREGNKEMKSLLGGKGANLAEMTNIGLNVPPGFTITTEACIEYYDRGKNIWEELHNEMNAKLVELEQESGKTFGGGEDPLLVSVRSGSVFSMPGMMDTILNLGLNDITVETINKNTNNERFAYDSYRRFIQMFSDVAMGISKSNFESALEKMKENKGVHNDVDLDANDLKNLVDQYKSIYKRENGQDFPQDPKEQLILAVKAVFDSWENPRAKIYRDLNNISHKLGTAVNIQSMVFGNTGDRSGTGVAFTRDPSTGENKVFGEFLMNAQGEDVVAGIRTPQSIDRLKDVMPKVFDQFIKTTQILEDHYKDMQDIEFTIENEKLYILQTRNGKRTAKASVNIAVEMVNEGKIGKEECISRIEPNILEQLLHPTFDQEELKKHEVLAKGLPASPGAACGKIYFHAEDVVAAKERGESAILVRQETSPEDIAGMVSSEGILTARGGMTSHAAVVARGMGKCCVAGASDIRVDENAKQMKIGQHTFSEGDIISLDGSTGLIYLGEIPKASLTMIENFEVLMGYVDEVRKLRVRANADNPRDAKKAVELGAEGIGLCRTEHMFFEEDRILKVRKMIMAENVSERVEALQDLLPFQRQDFVEIYEVMGSLPVTVRLLDPPLHEFLPNNEEDMREVAQAMGRTFDEVKDIVNKLHEFNPMLGHRGCRLAVTYPEIYRMQVRAIIEAALIMKDRGVDVEPEIMVPLIASREELALIKVSLVQEIEKVFEEKGSSVAYTIGTMIEVPRAAITADEIAREAEFFSFGTNDLTQMGFGFSRDDSGKFLNDYVEKEILSSSPFETLDQEGIGKFVQIACELGRKGRENIKLGVCGEHGGDPGSVRFFHKTGLDYVSCSPFRIPIARLAAAQAVIEEDRSL